MKEEEPSLTEEQTELITELREKKSQMKLVSNRRRSASRGHTTITAEHRTRTTEDLDNKLGTMGYDTEKVKERVRSMSREGRKRERSRSRSIDIASKEQKKRASTRSKTPIPKGVDEVQFLKAEKYRGQSDKALHKLGKLAESDRHVYDLKPKHLFSGKRSIGKTDRR